MDLEISESNEPEGVVAGNGSKDTPDIPADERTSVEKWVRKIKAAKKFHKEAFERMREDQYMATHGATKEWIAGKNYVVPLVSRHINEVVAQLYAKDPKAQAKRRGTLQYQMWDEHQGTLQALGPAAMQGDPNAQAVVGEVMQVRQQNDQIDKLGRTVETLWDYFVGEQEYDYKAQFKQLVRRAKVCGVGYVKLGFQRLTRLDPEVTAQINDATSQLKALERLSEEAAEGEIEPDSDKMYELKSLIGQLQQQETLILREGPIFGFPRSTDVIIDPACRHLKTFAGAEWIAEEFDMDPDRIQDVYGVDVNCSFTQYRDGEYRTSVAGDSPVVNDTPNQEPSPAMARVWEVQNKRLGQTFVVCDGYPGFLRAPASPDVVIDRFWTLFALVFNEIEDDKQLYPPSDVRLLKDTQMEYNRARQVMRDHRYAGRPGYVASKGAFEEEDLQKLQSHETNAIIELNGLQQGENIANKLMAKPVMPIDPNFYETAMFFDDIQRVVGSQAADLGGTSKATATETSVAAQSRQTWLASNTDDLDDLLSALAKATGQMMLLNLSKDTVLEIAGPGSVWPDLPPTREQVAKDLLLDIKAGSSGRPNAAQDLANMERAAPYLMQLPGVNPEPLVNKFASMLDLDTDEIYADGLPSIQAINAMMNAAARPGAGAPPPGQHAGGGDAPAQQGAQGVNNAPSTAAPPGPQPTPPTAEVVHQGA